MFDKGKKQYRQKSVLLDHTMTKNVQNTELHMAPFLAEHDLLFNLMDHMSDVSPILFPESKIADVKEQIKWHASSKMP